MLWGQGIYGTPTTVFWRQEVDLERARLGALPTTGRARQVALLARCRVFPPHQPDRAVCLARVSWRAGRRSGSKQRGPGGRAARAGSSRRPRAISSHPTTTSFTSCSTSFSPTSSPTFSSRIALRSTASSAVSVYFADHAGSFPTTSFSMPAMLAGQEYRNQKPAPEFVSEAFKQSSILDKVSGAGYNIDAIHDRPSRFVRAMDGSRGGAELARRAVPDTKTLSSAARITARCRHGSSSSSRSSVMFRTRLKIFGVRRPDTFYRAIWMDRTESPAQVRRHEASNSAAFLEQFASVMTVGRDRPVYKLLHVGVPHRPIVVDRECRFIGLTDMSRQSYTEQSRCAVKLVASLLDRARALGIYDSSLIIVSSDHGTDLLPLGFSGRSESLSLLPGPSTVRLPAIASTAKAVMMIKPQKRTGRLRCPTHPRRMSICHPRFSTFSGSRARRPARTCSTVIRRSRAHVRSACTTRTFDFRRPTSIASTY